MEYKELRQLTIISIIVGIAILIGIQWAMGTLGYMDVTVIQDPYQYSAVHIPQYEAVIGLYYATSLTIIAFMIYPVLKLRNANKKKKGEIEKKVEIPKIQENVTSKNIYCQSCGVEIMDKTADFCSKCGAPI